MWQLTDNEGLPSMEVYNIMQDRQGYIWFGTDNGLCRYDGHRFVNYYHPKQRGKSFSFFQEDAKGRIWCINFAGQIFYISNDSLHLFEPFEKVYKLGFPRIGIAPDNRIWVISEDNGVFSCPVDSSALQYHPQLSNGFFSDVLCTNKGQIVFRGPNIQLIRQFNIVDSIPGRPMLIHRSSHTDEIMGFKTVNQRLSISKIITTANTIRQVPLNTKAFGKIQAQLLNLITFGDDDNWLLTFDGAYLFKRKGNICTEVQHIMKGIPVSWVTRDREGTYWIGTLKNGVYVMPSKSVWVMSADNSPMQQNRVNRIAEDQHGQLYLGGANSSIYRFDISTSAITASYKLNETRKDIDFLKINPYQNRLYAHDIALFEIDLKTGKKTNTGNAYSAIKEMSFDPWGNVVFNNSYYGAFVPSAKGLVSPFAQHYPANEIIRGRPMRVFRKQRGIFNLLTLKDTSIYMAFIDGLYYFKNGQTKVLTDEQKQPIYATRMHESPDGLVWISTLQQGILAFKGDVLQQHLTTAQGLKSNFVRCIKTDSFSVWFATDKGIQGYLPAQKKLLQFTREDGLVTHDVSDIYPKGNKVYLATSKGFQWFDTRFLHPNLTAPPIYLIRIRMNEQPLPIQSSYSFNANQNNLDIRFSGLALRSRGNMRYKYRLSGLDSAWVSLPANENVIRFNTLPAGNYTFEVKAVNEDGTESIQAAGFKFSIAEPFWQTWWFAALILLLVSGSLTVLFQYRINIIRKSNNLEREKAKLEIALRSSQLSALKSQMNPHFIFNALNSIQEYILTNEKRLANSYLGKFSDLMRLYLDMSNKKLISLDEELKALQLYLELEAMRFEDSFSYSLHAEEAVHAEEIQLPPMLIQPYVENAIKHGLLHKRTNRVLQIDLKLAQQYLVCMIADNGIGRKKSAEINALRRRNHISFATSATQKRLELLNDERQDKISIVTEDILDKNLLVQGTCVTIRIPL